jgi:hypothetical protein
MLEIKRSDRHDVISAWGDLNLDVIQHLLWALAPRRLERQNIV